MLNNILENDINEFLESQNLKYDLSFSYISNIFLDIKNYLQFLKYKRYKIKKKPILLIIYKYFINNLNINEKVIELGKIKQPLQRSDEWYNIRYNIISASDASVILGKKFEHISATEREKIYIKSSFKSKKDLIKVKVLKKDEFVGNIYTEHGIIFEEVANLIYQKRNNTNVIDFGLVKHPKINFLGASPDGITKEGIMLEIKCPYKRYISGKIPSNYWVQMQLQLECCDLHYCDFVEIKVDFYESYEEYNLDTNINDKSLTQKNFEKGILIKYIDTNNKSIYLYPSSNIYNDYNLLNNWALDTYNSIKDIYNSVEYKYWKIEQYSCVRVMRDIEWFKNNLYKFDLFWKQILIYKNNNELFINDILNKKPKKSQLKKDKSEQKLVISESDTEEEKMNDLLISDSDTSNNSPNNSSNNLPNNSTNNSPNNSSNNSQNKSKEQLLINTNIVKTFQKKSPVKLSIKKSQKNKIKSPKNIVNVNDIIDDL